MTGTFHWFGDSWVAGDELAHPRQQAFARLVSDHYHARCCNLGLLGSSVTELPRLFHAQLHSIQPGDTVFFALTASSRTGFFDEHGDFQRVLTGAAPRHCPHPHSDKWFKYFDNKHQRVYNYDCVINMLWLWCQQQGILCYFFNLFTTEPHTQISCVPDSAWLIPRDQCVAQCILSCVDNEYGSVITADNPGLTDQQWQRQAAQVEQYIRPNWAHPNPAGHAKIAETLIQAIHERS